MKLKIFIKYFKKMENHNVNIYNYLSIYNKMIIKIYLEMFYVMKKHFCCSQLQIIITVYKLINIKKIVY
jgi:hypothetical protein